MAPIPTILVDRRYIKETARPRKEYWQILTDRYGMDVQGDIGQLRPFIDVTSTAGLRAERTISDSWIAGQTPMLKSCAVDTYRGDRGNPNHSELKH